MDRKTIETVAKLANQATSTNPTEGDTAARYALARLRKAGATFEEFLAEVPRDAVYQAGLARVADRYVADRADLSEPAKRELYAKLIAAVSAKYSRGAGEGGGRAREQDLRDKEEELRRREREAAEREERARRAEREVRGTRAQTEAGGQAGAKRNPSFSPAAGNRRIPAFAVWAEDPKRAARLYASCGILGCASGTAAVVAAALLAALAGADVGRYATIDLAVAVPLAWTAASVIWLGRRLKAASSA